MKILITGGKSAVALKLLKAFENEEIVLADYGDVPLFPSPRYTFISLGEKNEEITAHVLLNHCLDYAVDVLLPLQHFEIEAVAKAKILFNEFNVDLVLPEMETLMQYRTLPIMKKDWVLLIDGKVIYSTLDDMGSERIFTDLSGAFYVSNEEGSLRLTLMEI